MSSQWHRSPIVLVEDDPNDALFVRHALADAKIGNPLVVFRSAGEARLYVETTAPDRRPALFILAVSLEDGDTGLDFLRWLRLRAAPHGTTPVMMFTASDEAELRNESLDLGALVVLRKPVMPEDLVGAGLGRLVSLA